MQQDLRDWLDLSLIHSVPSSILILSRAFTVSGRLEREVAILATLSSLLDEVVDIVENRLPSEDSVSERRRKLEFLQMQEILEESEIRGEDVPLKEMTGPAREAEELSQAKALEEQEHLCRISRILALLASASSASRERQELLSLVNQEIDLYDTFLEKDDTEGDTAKELYRAARDKAAEIASRDKITSALQDMINNMVQSLKTEIDDVDVKIGDNYNLLHRDRSGKVSPEEVPTAAMYLRDTLSERIQGLMNSLCRERGSLDSLEEPRSLQNFPVKALIGPLLFETESIELYETYQYVRIKRCL